MMNPPHKLWEQANTEHPDDEARRTLRYLELMREAGHIIDREPGDDSPIFSCGFEPDIDEQLKAAMARIREAERGADEHLHRRIE